MLHLLLFHTCGIVHSYARENACGCARETSDRYVILDSAYREVLVSEDGELVSRPKQLRLLEKYQNIEYRVGFNEESSGLKPGYRVTRELFNELKFGGLMKYEVNKKKGRRNYASLHSLVKKSFYFFCGGFLERGILDDNALNA